MSSIICQCGAPLYQDERLFVRELYADGRARCPQCRRYWMLPVKVSVHVAAGATVRMYQSEPRRFDVMQQKCR